MFQLIGNHSGGHRAEHLAVFARLHLAEANKFRQRLRKFGHGVEFVRFALGPTLAQGLDLSLIGLRERNGQSLREKKIARVTGGDLDLVGFRPEADDIVSQNNFSLHFVDALNRKSVEAVLGHSTPNTQYPTNAPTSEVHWTFGVECWLLNV